MTALEIGRGPRNFEIIGSTARLSVPDRWMSLKHARLVRADAGGWLLEDSGSRNGTLHNGDTCRASLLSEGDVIELGHTFFVFRTDTDETACARQRLGERITDFVRSLPIERSAEVRFSIGVVRLLDRGNWDEQADTLRDILTTSVQESGHGYVDVEHLPAAAKSIRRNGSGVTTDPSRMNGPLMPEQEADHRAWLVGLLQEHKGNISAVSRVTGRARMQIHRWLKRHRINITEFRVE